MGIYKICMQPIKSVLIFNFSNWGRGYFLFHMLPVSVIFIDVPRLLYECSMVLESILISVEKVKEKVIDLETQDVRIFE